MAEWVPLSILAVVLWGIVGLLQKITTNYSSPDAVLIWDRVGCLALVPWLLATTSLSHLGSRAFLIGTLDGIANSLGAWFLYSALRSGAKASVVVPLTALYPLLTVLLAVGFLGEKLKPLQWCGVSLALVAAVLMSIETPEESLTEAGVNEIGE
jgi:bacterial/archaeal transporter family protein